MKPAALSSTSFWANPRRLEYFLPTVTLLSLASCVLWAYWPTLMELVGTWEKEPDYSHGYLVLPASLILLWNRRSTRPARLDGPDWRGAILLIIAGIMRFVSAKYFVSSVDAWSLPVAICGLITLFCGTAWLRWSWSAIAFLAFMVPLPWRVEYFLSSPLQNLATSMSCWGLQSIGYPAVQQGNTILLGEIQLEVEQACSGLRMLLSVTALAIGYLILRPFPWWQKSLVLTSIVPIALISNAVRIVTTGVLFKMASNETAQKFSHDFAGWLVIPIATALLFLVVAYIQALVVEYETAPLVKRPD
jgi:exosortase